MGMSMATRVGRLLLIFFWAGAAYSGSSSIIEAAMNGDENAARKMLEKNPDFALEKDARGYTALHWAGIRAHWHIFGHLLKAGAPVNAVGGDGGTPLHWACHHDMPKQVRLLLEKGADVSHANQWGRTPLHVAVRRGCRQVAELLLKSGADPNAPTKEGWTPLHVAYKAGHPDLVDLLLVHGADPDQLDGDGKRPEAVTMARPKPVSMKPESLRDFVGMYDLGRGAKVKVWLEGDRLRIREVAPDVLFPIDDDAFFCVQEPWRVLFTRDETGSVDAVNLKFLRRSVRGKRLNQPQYVGSQACRECHLGSDTGNEYLQWVSSRHAAAYWRLATDWSKLLAGFRPHFRDMTEPIEDHRCLLCHVTAAQDPEALLAPSFRSAEGVGCESCHGPGSLYIDEIIMQDRTKFLAHGGIVPTQETCRSCHRNADRFDFVTWWPKIDHTKKHEAEHP